MLPKNESLRKILVVFSFFETFCTRVGNSERFGQGKPHICYFFLRDFPRWCDGGCGGVENVVIWTFGRLVDGGSKRGWECQGVNWNSPSLAFLHLWPRWVFLGSRCHAEETSIGWQAGMADLEHHEGQVWLRWRWGSCFVVDV